MKHLTAALALLALSAPLFAAEDPCRNEAAKLCTGRTWEHGLDKCLRENRDKLSAACRARVVLSPKERQSEFKQACGADVKKYCQGIKQGEGRISDCLDSHFDQLSSTCQDKLDQFTGVT